MLIADGDPLKKIEIIKRNVPIKDCILALDVKLQNNTMFIISKILSGIGGGKSTESKVVTTVNGQQRKAVKPTFLKADVLIQANR